MNVVGREAGPFENRRRFSLTVDSLLPQNRDGGSHAACDVWRGDVVFGIEAQCDRQTGVVLGTLGFVLLIGALRIIAQTTHSPRGL